MTAVIGQRELRNDSGVIMRELTGGKTLIVTRNQVPVGELRPLRRSRTVRREVLLAALAGAPEVDHERWIADLDASIDQDPEPHA
ncbi:Uncharacterised protein [Actinomyces denticolens]|uniref:prevent-host-death protein n=1 Tax=Actinomyces TaxID=1654 RepID=UPI00098094A4|nr:MULTISPECIES: prevent-host-death protein [Actinomyces]GAV93332.1 hypothetical protein ADENT20671_0075 [Actinomyces denticolens]SUU74464.1 Uncharacterised protein [Actinomyces denticolens]